MKSAVLLCGGNGTRLASATNHYNKALITLNEHFVIDYPMNTLVKMGITRITVVLGGDHFADVVSYLKDGQAFGVEINYVFQREANGVAAAINLAKPYVESEDSFVVLLGDNVFSEPPVWNNATAFNPQFAQIALKRMGSNQLVRFGVASTPIEHVGQPLPKIIKIEEKPKVIDHSLENFAITGCYLFNRDFFSMFKRLKKSERGEFEITEIIQQYLDRKELHHTFVDGDWQDAGTWESIAVIRKMIDSGRIKI